MCLSLSLSLSLCIVFFALCGSAPTSAEVAGVMQAIANEKGVVPKRLSSGKEDTDTESELTESDAADAKGAEAGRHSPNVSYLVI